MAFMGELGDIEISHLLYVIALGQRSGKLTVTADGHEVSLYISDGQLVSVSASSATLRLGKIFVRMGAVTQHQLHDALQLQEQGGDSRTLGAILLGRGDISPANLARCIEEQCIEGLTRVISATNGTFVFVPGVMTPARVEIVPLQADRILLDAVRRTDELSAIRAYLPDHATPLHLTGTIERLAGALNDAELLVASMLLTAPSSLLELADRLPLDQLTLCRAIVALQERGILHHQAPSLSPASRARSPRRAPNRTIRRRRRATPASSPPPTPHYAPPRVSVAAP